LTAKTI